MHKLKNYMNAIPIILILLLVIGTGYFLFSQEVVGAEEMKDSELMLEKSLEVDRE